MPEILTLWGLREDEHGFKDNLDYIVKTLVHKAKGWGAIYLSCTRPWVPAWGGQV